MPDLKCQVLLVGDPGDTHAYFPGRSFLLRSTTLVTDLPLSGFLARRARLFVGTHGPTTHLITLSSLLAIPPPSGNPHVHLGVGEEEIDLLEIDVVSAPLTSKKEGTFRISARVPLRSTALLEDKASWIFPLLVPRRLPASLRLRPTGNSPCLSLWSRLT
jgi:hypothetical protein